MSHGSNFPDSVSRRLARLETSLVRWRRAALVCALAGALPWAIGAARTAGESGDLRVTSLTLVSVDGAEHATLMLDAGKPVLALRDGARHATLTLADGNAGLACGGPTGVTFAGVSASGAYFNARGTDLKTGVFAGVEVDGDAAFRAYGADMRVAAALQADTGGTPTLRLSDPRSGETTLPAQSIK